MPLYFADPGKVARMADAFDATALSADAYLGTQESGFFPFDLRAQLPQVTARTLVLVGAGDSVCPVGEAERIDAALPDSRLRVVPGAGHFPWIENPDAFYAAVRGWMEG